MQYFKLDTLNTSYIFEVMDSGHLQQLYYGKKIANPCEITPLEEKLGTSLGTTVAYSAKFPTLNLNNLSQEISTSGKGDYREPFILVKNSNGSLVSNFLFSRAEHISNFELDELPSSYAKTDTLAITLTDKGANLDLILYYSTFADCDIITRSAKLVNNGEKTIIIEKIASLQLDLPYANLDMTTLDGAWGKERQITKRTAQIGLTQIDSKCGISSNIHNPFVILSKQNTTDSVGDGYGFNLIYSGNHKETCEVTIHNKTRFMTGISDFGFSWTLQSKASFVTPEATMVFSDLGTNGISQQYHTFVNEHIVRGVWKNKLRPILVNNWEATYFNFTQKKLLDLAQKASSLGIELFVLDDGWFGKRTDDTKALGDWYVNKSRFPDGLSGICDKINKLGLDFGIWVEPEMVNPDSDLFRSHPDWAVTNPDYDYSLSRNQLLLDYTNKDVRDYIVTRLTDIFSSANISYVKWDFNRPMSDFYSPTLTNQGEFFHKYTLGLYDVLSRLTKKFDKILFESCASGGNRVDLGMLCYMPQYWCSDNTDSCDRTKIQEGTLLAYPASTLGAHVSACPNHQTLRMSTIDNRFNVASMGLLGYELDLNKLSNNDLKSVKEQISYYKKYRQTLQYGKQYKLSSIFTSNLSSFIRVSPDKQTAIVGMFYGQAITSPPSDILKLDGLEDATKYVVTTKKQSFEAKQFGDLINIALPHLANNPIFKMVIEHGYSLETECEKYTSYGDLLCNAGIKLYQAFSSSGWNETVRILTDYGGRLYSVEAVKDKQK
ncbi:MAG: alpha-galactosidase [Clostridia bacterium]